LITTCQSPVTENIEFYNPNNECHCVSVQSFTSTAFMLLHAYSVNKLMTAAKQST